MGKSVIHSLVMEVGQLLFHLGGLTTHRVDVYYLFWDAPQENATLIYNVLACIFILTKSVRNFPFFSNQASENNRHAAVSPFVLRYVSRFSHREDDYSRYQPRSQYTSSLV